eukprot:CAMPEP_0181090002 /NCGR_PEP_ID=MMETSP1071-20121207/7602_1 /TAXON_ID=35127 /ORGANISM="Thalassiosira sp., Strain NH16" /LENGTH=94 /DNA_ID=CAMNT_0023171985 /DNA_START=1031 /DNA_END=1312 /DNA_ORIENTATION=+
MANDVDETLAVYSTLSLEGDGLEVKPGRLEEVANLVDSGFKAVLDPFSPLPFFEDGMKRGPYFDDIKLGITPGPALKATLQLLLLDMNMLDLMS